MPIFNNNITFIHIPKSGGTSIENFLVSKGMKMEFFSSDGKIFHNGHTPQHSTFRELDEINLLTDKVFTILRPDVERCISEWHYTQNYRKDLKKESFDEFLDFYLDKRNVLKFDNHNLPNREFLINNHGEIDERIEIIDFFDIDKIENYLGLTGLSKFHEMNFGKKNIQPTTEQIERIKNYFESWS